MIVRDKNGKVLCKVDGANSLDELDLRQADFCGQVLEGAYLDDSDLSGANLSGADLYWAIGFRTRFDGADLRNANLAGASLRQASFLGADLRNAYVSHDNLGGSPTLEGADLTGARLDGANLTGCEYNDATRFPEGFNPSANGMVWVDPRRVFIRPGSFASASLRPGSYIEVEPGVLIPDKNKEDRNG